jgi:site-specific DNA-methyltransferase (adenine-specific)
MEDWTNKVIQGDCLEVMKDIPDGSVDMILADLPYGTTACKWDTIIPFEPLWEHYKRIIKPNGAIVLTASQPFTSALVMSNPKMFKYEWVWEKNRASNPMLSKIQPLKFHENVLVFSNGKTAYQPQMEYVGIKDTRKTFNTIETYNERFDSKFTIKAKKDDGYRFPKSILKILQEHHSKIVHPTQKPVALFEYLIKTYTNEGDLVLDNCAGSFTTAIASENLKRNWICIEKEAEYCAIGEKRIKENRERLLNIAKKILLTNPN